MSRPRTRVSTLSTVVLAMVLKCTQILCDAYDSSLHLLHALQIYPLSFEIDLCERFVFIVSFKYSIVNQRHCLIDFGSKIGFGYNVLKIYTF